MMKLEDYAYTCDVCGGDGVIVHTTDNYLMSTTTRKNCDKCGGRGTVLTDDGKELVRILQFLKQKNFI